VQCGVPFGVRRGVLAGAVCMGLLAGVGRAQEAALAAAAVAQPERWTLQFEPAVWYVSPGGHVKFPGAPSGTEATFLDQLNLDSPRASPAGELHLYSEDWTLTLRGFAVSLENRGTVATSAFEIGDLSVAAGDRVFASLDLKSLDATASTDIALPASLAGEPGGGFAARMELIGGLRAMDLGMDVSGPAGGVSYGGLYLHPVIGVKLTMDLTPRFTIDLQLDGGGLVGVGGRESFSYDILAGFMWRPTEHVAAQIGYRALGYQFEEGSGSDRFLYRGALQGLYGGMVLRF